MKTAEQWLPELRDMVDHVRADPPSIGVLSMGQQCAVALVLDRERLMPSNDDRLLRRDPREGTVMRPRGYTWLDCVNRIEPELLQACLKLQRELGIG